MLLGLLVCVDADFTLSGLCRTFPQKGSSFLQTRNFLSLLCAYGKSRLWTPYSCIMAHLRNKILHVCLLFGLFSVLKDLQKCSLPGVNGPLHLLTVTNNSADILQVCNSIDNVVSG